MTGNLGTGPAWDEPSGEDLDRTETLLARLGRRRPSPADLDDPLVAALALLASDVDLRPVPVSATRRALADAVETGCDEPDLPGCPEGAIVAPRCPIERRSSARTRPLPRPGSPAAPLPRRARPRVVRLRSPFGLVAAAALVVVGGGMSAIATDDDLADPLTRLTSAVQGWAGSGPAPVTYRKLQAQVEAARAALEQGRPADAAQLISDVRRQFGTLSTAQQARQAELADAIAELEDRLQDDPATAASDVPPVAPTTDPGQHGRVDSQTFVASDPASVSLAAPGHEPGGHASGPLRATSATASLTASGSASSAASGGTAPGSVASGGTTSGSTASGGTAPGATTDPSTDAPAGADEPSTAPPTSEPSGPTSPSVLVGDPTSSPAGTGEPTGHSPASPPTTTYGPPTGPVTVPLAPSTPLRPSAAPLAPPWAPHPVTPREDADPSPGAPAGSAPGASRAVANPGPPAG